MGNGSFYNRASSNSVQGVAPGDVPAYSNHRVFSFRGNYLYGIYTGIQWQCVEFARRWLLLRKSCTFPDIDIAANIWNTLSYVERVTDGKKFRLIGHQNGSNNRPKQDSFLVYPRSRQMSVGHVAVITNIDQDYVYIAEQNNNFHHWPSNYARRAPISVRNGCYYIDDDFTLYGWMEIEGSNHLQPLKEADASMILEKYKG